MFLVFNSEFDFNIFRSDILIFDTKKVGFVFNNRN